MPPSSISTDQGDTLEDGLLKGSAADRVKSNVESAEGDDGDDGYLTDREWVAMFKDALRASSDYMETKLRTQWSRNYRAFNSRHPNGTKYETRRYRNRSKIFKPKTRMAVRKNDATGASAMFSTNDVVSIKARRSSDPVQAMGAKFIHACLNYRLDQESFTTGPNWFLTAVGARQDAQVAGICVTKQYWEYETKTVPTIEWVTKTDANGMPIIDEASGLGIEEEDVTDKIVVVRDRLMIANIPPEHAYIDPTGDWRNPIQDGGNFIAAFPIRQEELETMVEKNRERSTIGGGAWRADIDIKKCIAAGKSTRASRRGQQVRLSRDENIDRYESRHASKDSEVIWLYECFYRYNGEDWHFWTLGETILLSDPRPTIDSYPEQKGMRPYVRGLGALETHKTHPTAPVEQWAQLQNEMNEVTNLNLDAMKMGISPITKVVRGRNIDLKQVQNRGPDAHIMVDSKDDVEFDKAPGSDAGAINALNHLNVDFDELAGVFSPASVQTNRELNETVGGMQMLQGGTNATTEFDLRVWVETWAEPCLAQCALLIAYYESDETALAVAGEKAGLIIGGVPAKPPSVLDGGAAPDASQQQGITLDQVLEVIDDMPIRLKVNVGIGAMDSKQKLDKLMVGTKASGEMAPLLQKQGIEIDAPAILNELWGLVGYEDADRFYKKVDPAQQQPPPEVQAEQAKGLMAKQKHDQDMQKGEADERRAQQEHDRKMAEMDQKERIAGEQAAAAHKQGIEKSKGDADAKRIEQGLPGDEVFSQIVMAMQAQAAQQRAMMTQMMDVMRQQSQENAQAIQTLAAAITAPRTVQLPDGRTFTAESRAN